MRQPDYEAFLKLLEELKGYTLIVEGKKDKRALKSLGLINVIPISGKPLADFVGGLDERSHIGHIVILTDFDKEGKRIAARLLKLLQRRRIKTNPRLRRMFMEMGKTRIEDWGACSAAALTLRANGARCACQQSWQCIKEKGDNHGEIGANFYEIHNKSKRKGERHNREA